MDGNNSDSDDTFPSCTTLIHLSSENWIGPVTYLLPCKPDPEFTTYPQKVPSFVLYVSETPSTLWDSVRH